jgi:hypothetical protein
MSTTITATEVTEGMRVYHSVHANAITVTKVRHNVAYYTQRVTFVYGTDAHGVLVELICHPAFEFVPAED